MLQCTILQCTILKCTVNILQYITYCSAPFSSLYTNFGALYHRSALQLSIWEGQLINLKKKERHWSTAISGEGDDKELSFAAFQKVVVVG